jgi:hypothetical protein
MQTNVRCILTCAKMEEHVPISLGLTPVIVSMDSRANTVTLVHKTQHKFSLLETNQMSA